MKLFFLLFFLLSLLSISSSPLMGAGMPPTPYLTYQRPPQTSPYLLDITYSAHTHKPVSINVKGKEYHFTLDSPSTMALCLRLFRVDGDLTLPLPTFDLSAKDLVDALPPFYTIQTYGAFFPFYIVLLHSSLQCLIKGDIMRENAPAPRAIPSIRFLTPSQ